MRLRLMIALLACTMVLMGCGANGMIKDIEVSSSDDSISILQEGNEDYLKGKTGGHTTQNLREKLTTEGQHPYAVVITCSDSRVPVEEIFSCNAGEIFVIRTAGNVIGDLEMGSIEYGVEHCGAPLVLVLGHTNCGAVTAAAEGEAAGNSIDEIIKHIEPAVNEARKTNDDLSAIIAEGIKINVLNDIEQIKADESLKECIDSGKTQVKGAIYDIESGKVEWLDF